MAYSDYNQQFWDLGKRFAEESSGVWQRYAKMATRSQHLDAETFRQRLTTFWQQDTPEYSRRLMQIHLDYTVNMMKMGLEFSNVMLDSLFGEVSSEASTSPASPPSGAGATRDPVDPISRCGVGPDEKRGFAGRAAGSGLLI